MLGERSTYMALLHVQTGVLDEPSTYMSLLYVQTGMLGEPSTYIALLHVQTGMLGERSTYMALLVSRSTLPATARPSCVDTTPCVFSKNQSPYSVGPEIDRHKSNQIKSRFIYCRNNVQ